MTLTEKISELAEGVASGNGLELVEVQCSQFGKGGTIRVFIEKANGVNIDDCTQMSRSLSPLLDAEGILNGSYTLEVSSPGIDKPLTSKKDFERNINRKLKVSFSGDEEKVYTVFGKLTHVDDERIELKVNNESQWISLASINKAKVEVEFK